MSQFLLDTDTISYFFRGVSSVQEKVEQELRSGNRINFSVISYYEICNGLYYKDAKKQLQGFKEFSSHCNVLPLLQEITDLSAQIYAELRRNGTTVSHTDVLIAGTAIYHDMQLVTNNIKDFQNVDNLQLDNWLIV